MSGRRHWTTAEVRNLRALYPDRNNRDISVQFGRSPKAIGLMALKLGLSKSALHIAGHCRFGRGHVAWNKGKAWNPIGSKATQFAKGHRGGRYKPVGTERRGMDVVYVKIADPDVWERKPRVIWEKNFGPIPAGAIVRCSDGNPENCAPENLKLVTRSAHLRLNWKPRGRAKKPVVGWIAPLKMAA